MIWCISRSGSAPPDRGADGYRLYPVPLLRGGTIDLPDTFRQIGPMMATRTAPPPAPPAPDTVSAARLHGEACWHCGAVHTAFTVIGKVSTPVPGGHRVWPVVGCPAHAEVWL